MQSRHQLAYLSLHLFLRLRVFPIRQLGDETHQVVIKTVARASQGGHDEGNTEGGGLVDALMELFQNKNLRKMLTRNINSIKWVKEPKGCVYTPLRFAAIANS